MNDLENTKRIAAALKALNKYDIEELRELRLQADLVLMANRVLYFCAIAVVLMFVGGWVRSAVNYYLINKYGKEAFKTIDKAVDLFNPIREGAKKLVSKVKEEI